MNRIGEPVICACTEAQWMYVPDDAGLSSTSPNAPLAKGGCQKRQTSIKDYFDVSRPKYCKRWIKHTSLKDYFCSSGEIKHITVSHQLSL